MVVVHMHRMDNGRRTAMADTKLKDMVDASTAWDSKAFISTQLKGF